MQKRKKNKNKNTSSPTYVEGFFLISCLIITVWIKSVTLTSNLSSENGLKGKLN